MSISYDDDRARRVSLAFTICPAPTRPAARYPHPHVKRAVSHAVTLWLKCAFWCDFGVNAFLLTVQIDSKPSHASKHRFTTYPTRVSAAIQPQIHPPSKSLFSSPSYSVTPYPVPLPFWRKGSPRPSVLAWKFQTECSVERDALVHAVSIAGTPGQIRFNSIVQVCQLEPSLHALSGCSLIVTLLKTRANILT